MKNLEAKLAIAAPDESKWFATYPTVMKLIKWRCGDVEGNIMPHMGEMEEERFIKDLEGIKDPKARTKKLWIGFVLKKATKATKNVDQYFKDGILRTADGTLMGLKPDHEARVHKIMKSTGRSKMIERCKMVDQATAQMMENGELQEDDEELLSLLREIREWCKMAVNGISTPPQEAILVPSASSKSATADTENKDLCSPAAAGVSAASAAAASVPSPPYVPSLSFDDTGENILSVDLPVVEAMQVDVDMLEASLPLAPCGPIISPSEEQEVEENEGKEGPVAC